MTTLKSTRPILIVDDDDRICRLYKHVLENENYACTIAHSAEQARKLIHAAEYGLVLCDIKMPEEDGIEFITKLRKDQPHIAVIMITGVDDKTLAEKALRNSVHGYLLKPISNNQLIISVDNALRRSVLEKENYSHMTNLERIVAKRTAELEKSREKLLIFKEFADNASQGLVIGSLDGKVVYVNPVLANMAGAIECNQMVGKSISDYYPDELRERLDQEVIPATLSKGSWQGELCIQSRDGNLIPTLEHYFIIKDKSGEPLYVADTITDMTEVKAMHTAIVASRAGFCAIVDRCDEAFIITDMEGSILFVNPKTEVLFGHGAESLVGEPFGYPLVEGESLEIDIIRADRQSGTGEIRVVKTDWEGKPALLISIRDITERVKMEADLKKTVHMLESANRKIIQQQKAVIEEERLKVLLQMAGATAHEMNQPLNILLGNIQLMEIYKDKPAKLEECIPKIIKAGNRISKIVKKIQTIRSTDTIPYTDGSSEIINLDQKIKILCIDQSEADYHALKDCLKAAPQMVLRHASDLRSAVQELTRDDYDLIIAEHQLPDGTGLEFLQQQTAAGYDTPIVIMTDHGNEIVAAQSIQAGAYDYIPKDKISLESMDRIIFTSLEKFRLKQELQQAMHKMADLSTKDELTGLYNRRYFEELLEREVSRAKRYGTDLVVSIIDLDHFKHVNDTYGHSAGDKVLERVGLILKDIIRKSDNACRYGGEEFVLIMPSITISDASLVSNRFRTILSATEFSFNGSSLKITASVGISAMHHSRRMTADKLVEHADKALYRAKNNGRDQTVVWEKTTRAAD